MGHDITAYLGRGVPSEPHMAASPDELREEIASLRGSYWMYEALDAQMYNGVVSGIGIGRWFTRDQLRTGLEHLRLKEPTLELAGRTCRPGITFLEACLDQLPAVQDWVYIDFG